jgi:hypothetical protein
LLTLNQCHLADDLNQIRFADLAEFCNGRQARFAIEDVELDFNQLVIRQSAFKFG